MLTSDIVFTVRKLHDSWKKGDSPARLAGPERRFNVKPEHLFPVRGLIIGFENLERRRPLTFLNERLSAMGNRGDFVIDR